MDVSYHLDLTAQILAFILFFTVLGGLHNQLSGALVYGPLFGHVWLDAMNKVYGTKNRANHHFFDSYVDI